MVNDGVTHNWYSTNHLTEDSKTPYPNGSSTSCKQIETAGFMGTPGCHGDCPVVPLTFSESTDLGIGWLIGRMILWFILITHLIKVDWWYHNYSKLWSLLWSILQLVNHGEESIPPIVKPSYLNLKAQCLMGFISKGEGIDKEQTWVHWWSNDIKWPNRWALSLVDLVNSTIILNQLMIVDMKFE